jgi:hypothetical protein|tara:strand:- start:347 stop:691 length:345 start_codon:yes stop_codon:yes gene_type:complete
MTDAEKIEALKANLGNLDEKGRTFADSLLSYWEKRGVLSKKQLYWVGKLAGLEEPKAKGKAKASKAKPDARFETMLSAFRGANDGQRKRLMKAIHPDLWGNAPWAEELFKAANK